MKGLIKYFVLLAHALLRRDMSPKVVFYHDIGKKHTPMGTDVKTFMRHMNVLGAGGRCRGDVVAFDDGFRGIFEHREMLKEMKARGEGEQWKIKVFVAPRLVGQPGYLTWDEIRMLNREYGIDFQCHTWSHQTLVGPMIDESPKEERTEAWYHRELVTSREEIAHQLGEGEGAKVNSGVDELCFPVGYFNDELIERCKKAGYKKVYASYPGNVCDDYVQPRCLVQDLGPMAFRAVLNGGMMVLKKRYFSKHYCV